ncbi:MAG: cathelicidin antimicrobial peptide protein [Siphoviridae sp. ctCJE6]|nr:MAG: cathelicidin antimicrobial peptide protein [Siphoviridae sp. ctCJE6]
MSQSEEWEKDFDKQFPNVYLEYYGFHAEDRVKDFIRNLLTRTPRRLTVEEVAEIVNYYTIEPPEQVLKASKAIVALQDGGRK